MNNNVWQTLDSNLCMQENLVKDNGHSLVLVPKRSGILWKKTVHKESWTNWRKRCWLNLRRADVHFSVLRLHCPEVNSEANGKLSIHFAAVQETIETIFSILVSANQLSLYGAVANMCEECETLHDRSGDLMCWWDNQLCSVRSRQKFLWIVMMQHIGIFYCSNLKKDLRGFHNKIKFCMDAGFLSVVEFGQYFMTKDIGEQFHAMACREYKLLGSDESSQPKGWIQGNTRILTRIGSYDQLLAW